MSAGDVLRLGLLAAIWGAAYLSIRIAAPAVGAFWTAEARLLIGAAALAVWFGPAGLQVRWRETRQYLLIGVFGALLPFTLFGFAGMRLDASIMAVLNATAPMMSLGLTAALGSERFTLGKSLGMLLGLLGVWWITQGGAAAGAALDAGFVWAVAACLGGAFSYALTGVLVQRYCAGTSSRGMAFATQAWAAVLLAPATAVAPVPGEPDAIVLANLVALGLLASGVAYVLWFRLIDNIGPVRTQTVSFLTPLFAFACAALFLGERLTGAVLLGSVSIVAGVSLVILGKGSSGNSVRRP